MSDTVIIKRNDTWPPLKAELRDEVGPIDLTNAASIKLRMRSSSVYVVASNAQIVDPIQRKIEYHWQPQEGQRPADTAFVGEYQVEWEIIWAAGGVQTVPSQDYNIVKVIRDLDGPAT